MTEEVFSRALEAFEAMPSEGTLERAVGSLVRGGVEISQVRNWARSNAQAYGIWPYVARTFDRMMTGAAKLAQSEG